jgi:deoxyribonuclease-4
MSVAGGVALAVGRAALHGCEALQIFTKNASQWRGRPLPPEDVAAFRARLAEARIQPAISHASYLINLAAPASPLRAQSIDAMADELERATALDLLGVVLHPGSAVNRARGLKAIARALRTLLDRRVPGRTMVLLEHTAGQGNTLGATFEELAVILSETHGHARIGVCLDTCHLLASGYNITTDAGYAETFESFGRVVGFDRLKAFHMNDSKKPLGSRVDRHTHIGEGYVGLDAFRRLVNDPRFADMPMILETPKEETRKPKLVALDPHDERNLRTLRSLVESRPA